VHHVAGADRAGRARGRGVGRHDEVTGGIDRDGSAREALVGEVHLDP
jgi:hypothetical protein